MLTDDLAEPTMAQVIAAFGQETRRNGYFLLVSSTSDLGPSQSTSSYRPA
jgi:hypothetical protein